MNDLPKNRVMRLLDLFCGAGGAGLGYHRAGFEVVGVDIASQPHYPFKFVQADALEYVAVHGTEFDAIHASPPCQSYSNMTKRWPGQSDKHPDLIAPTRAALIATGKPYVIENVVGAPVENPMMLCGTMFDLQTKYGNQLRRHRLFELSWNELILTPPCKHLDGSAIGVHGTEAQHPKRRRSASIGVYGHTGGSSARTETAQFTVADRRDAMGIDWMTNAELIESIPPAFTEYLGGYLMRYCLHEQ